MRNTSRTTIALVYRIRDSPPSAPTDCVPPICCSLLQPGMLGVVICLFLCLPPPPCVVSPRPARAAAALGVLRRGHHSPRFPASTLLRVYPRPCPRRDFAAHRCPRRACLWCLSRGPMRPYPNWTGAGHYFLWPRSAHWRQPPRRRISPSEAPAPFRYASQVKTLSPA